MRENQDSWDIGVANHANKVNDDELKRFFKKSSSAFPNMFVSKLREELEEFSKSVSPEQLIEDLVPNELKSPLREAQGSQGLANYVYSSYELVVLTEKKLNLVMTPKYDIGHIAGGMGLFSYSREHVLDF